MATARRATPGAAKKTTAKKTAAKKTAAKKAVAKPKPPPPEEPGISQVMVRIGGHEYPQTSSRSCHTCQSPYRRFIENEIVLGRGYLAIWRRLVEMPLSDGQEHPSNQGISRHVLLGHMPTPATIRREIVDIEAKRLGSAFTEGQSLVTHRVVNQNIIQRGYERLMEGDIDVSVSDLLQAIGNQQKIESTSVDGYEVEAMQEALMVYMELAMRFIPPEQRNRYGAEISKHPIIRAIAARQRGEGEVEVVTQDGEAVQQTRSA